MGVHTVPTMFVCNRRCGKVEQYFSMQESSCVILPTTVADSFRERLNGLSEEE